MIDETVVVLGSGDDLSTSIASALGGLVEDLVEPISGEPDGVVIVFGAEPAPMPVTDIGPMDWQRLAELPILQVMLALQHARRALTSRGGRIVLVVPTIGMAGAPHLVPYTTAVEGVRAMAKSAARQWVTDGISVNVVAAPAHAFAEALHAETTHLTAAALKSGEGLVGTIVEVTKFLLRRDVTHLVGATVIADGGSVMVP